MREPEAEGQTGRISGIMEEVIPEDGWTALMTILFRRETRTAAMGVETMPRMYLLLADGGDG